MEMSGKFVNDVKIKKIENETKFGTKLSMKLLMELENFAHVTL